MDEYGHKLEDDASYSSAQKISKKSIRLAQHLLVIGHLQ
jgi:hypothetical protein